MPHAFISAGAPVVDSALVSIPCSVSETVSISSAQEQPLDRDPHEAPSSAPAYFNLAMKQKAICQPVFRFRRWLEQAKSLVPENQEESIHHL
jgi:hypothetical protein